MSSNRHIAVVACAPLDRRVLSWWGALCALAALNVGAWFALWAVVPDAGDGLQLALSGVYVAVCAYRSVLPRVDLERLVLVDSRLSSILVGRAAATVAEICFGLQLGLLVHRLGEQAGLPVVQQVAWAIPACMVVAQLFCWHSVLTLNHVTQAVESMLWAAGFACMAALLALVAVESQGRLQILAMLGVAGSLLFVSYVLAVDAPMYWRRHRDARARGQATLRWQHGARDAWQRRVPEHRWPAWKADALWLTPYFSVGVWVSLAIVVLAAG